jgi:hypothetical protein
MVFEKFHIHGGDNLPFSSWLDGACRTHLAELFGELGYTQGAEVGVRSGNFSLELLQNIPELHIKCVDSWAAYAKVSQSRQDKHFEHCKLKLKEFADKGQVEFIKAPSLEAVALVPDKSLDFVYIDGRHEFDFVIRDIIEWSRKVRIGGIVAGHDYTYPNGVTQAVDKYVEENIVALNITKEDDVPKSWFWVKEK